MSGTYPSGSEWRKWDLHIHLPGTKLSNGYEAEGDILVKFCEMIENSDGEALGITDYFSVDGYFEFVEKYYGKYPESTKVLFPNIELRLNENVNSAQEEVNIHIIFPPDISKRKAQEFLSNLKTEITDGDDRQKNCLELSASDYATATVTRTGLESAITATFGKKAVRQDKLLIITAANNDGLRAVRGSARKANISDQIEKLSDGYFGGSQNTEYFLQHNRLEDEEQFIKSKPVFSGSDAHNFTDLENWLGKSVSIESARKEITWIKANPTFEGLQQTLIEPAERVKIQDLKPDVKEPYKVIKSVSFSGNNDFPTKLEFNGNLSSIIGSRSSGKSALLAYIAHSIDPDDTLVRQMSAQEQPDRSKIGPAAGKTWQNVANVTCTVEWGTGESESGRVIYIPQNYLYSISKRPEEVTKKIEPVLFKNYPVTKNQFEKTNSEVGAANEVIREATREWFDFDGQIQELKGELKNIGDKSAVESAKASYKVQIDELKKTLSVSQEDLDNYQLITEQISQKQTRIETIGIEQQSLSPFLSDDETPSAININPSITFSPNLYGIPSGLATQVNEIVDVATAKVNIDVSAKVISFHQALVAEETKLKQEIQTIEATNKDLITKNQQNAQLSKLVDDFNKQSGILTSIEAKEKSIQEFESKKSVLTEKITGGVLARSQAFLAMSQVFSGISQELTEMDFGVEIELNEVTVGNLTEQNYDKRENSPYIKDGVVDLLKIRSEVGSYLNHMNTVQKLKTGQTKKQTAIATLCTCEEIRFNATLEGDKIGGFSLSTMTPGKQALFALTLILDESDDSWPLLIDQPEDDLDSRSIYDYIVPYLVERKRERQILMVSHNANLVVGADSEQILVANRHGVDRKNRDSKTFDYLTGAIEDSKERVNRQFVLETCGIREHAIDILDGGKEAFEKRKDKYKI